MGRRFAGYGDTEALGDDELRQVAEADDAMDRVLACWRLMTRGQALRTIGAPGPDAGIRRLLLLGLAAGQETALLVTIAEHDPEPEIRQEALVWVWRIAPAEGLALLRARIAAEADDELLRELPTTLPDVPWSELVPELEGLLLRDAPGLRARAAELLLELDPGVSSAVRRAIAAETDPELRARLLLRWAGSEAHATLLAAAAETPTLAVTALQALHAAGRRYEWEVLRSFEGPETRLGIVRAMGPPFSAGARGWLLARVQRALAAGEDPEELLGRLAEAIADGVPETLGGEDRVVVELLAAERGADIEASALAHLLKSSSRWLRHRAAERWVAQSPEIPEVVRRFALVEANPVVLARWADSPAHHELLASLRPRPGVSLPWQLYVFAVAALAGARRVYPWDELAELTAATEDACAWTDDAGALADLAAMIREPWPPEARAWVVQAEPQLTRPEILRRLWDAISAVPVDERSPEELDCLDQIARRQPTLRLRDVADWSFEDD